MWRRSNDRRCSDQPHWLDAAGIVIVQHEFGIYGGPSGSLLLESSGRIAFLSDHPGGPCSPRLDRQLHLVDRERGASPRMGTTSEESGRSTAYPRRSK